MIPRDFQLRIDDTHDGVLAHVVGPLDVEHAPGFRERLLPHLRQARRIIVNLIRTDYVDSEGVRSLMALHRSAEAAHADLRLVLQPGSRAERTFVLLRLQDHFRIHRSVREALQPESKPDTSVREPVAAAR
jgi:anti-anti-sigma factor